MTNFSLSPQMHSGTLSDEQIRNACSIGWLIDSQFSDTSIHQACYELRASNIYYEHHRVDRDTTPVRHELPNEDFILLKPKQIITIITLESLKLPDCIVGRVLTKGRLFSAGIIPVNTYADPGFQGRLGITFANMSNNYIKIQQSMPIAKIEFSKLRSPVQKPYQGQHGYQTEIWPIPHELFVTREELKHDRRLLSPVDEITMSHGPILGALVSNIYVIGRRFVIATTMYFTFTIVLIAAMVSKGSEEVISTTVAVVLGVCSNAAYGLLAFVATRLKGR